VLAEDLGVTDRVHFLGRRPMATMPALLATADLQLACIADTPLFRVNMPSKIPSLLAGGHPVLVVAEGDPADVVTAADAGLAASPNDPAAVATALRQAKAPGADICCARWETGAASCTNARCRRRSAGPG